jgi:hypothetical protein
MASHQKKRTHQKKKHRRKHPEHESDENNGTEKETMVRWVESWGRKEKNEVMVGKGKNRQGWGWRRSIRHRWWCVRKEEKREVLNQNGRGGGTRVKRTRLVEGHISRNMQPACHRIQTTIALMLITIPKKHTLNRLSRKFGAFTRVEEEEECSKHNQTNEAWNSLMSDQKAAQEDWHPEEQQKAAY